MIKVTIPSEVLINLVYPPQILQTFLISSLRILSYCFKSKITKLMFITSSNHFITYHTTFHDVSVSEEEIQQLLPGSLSFLQQELQ